MFLEYISVASSINFLFLAIALFLKKTPDKKSNKILFVLFLIMAVYCALVAFHFDALEHHNFGALFYYSPIDGILMLFMGPCLYLYVRSVLNMPTPVLKVINLLHLLPFIPYICFCIYFLTLPFQQRIDWLIHDFNSSSAEMKWLNVIIYSQTITYFLLCYRLVSKQLKTTTIIQFESTLFDIGWLKKYLIVNLSFTILTLPLCFIISNERTNIIIGLLAMDIQFVYMFFKWILHNDFSDLKKFSNLDVKSNALKLNSDFADTQLEKLNTFMEDFKLYLDEACCLQTLSVHTGIPQYQLTNLLNCKLQKTIPDYINEYRIHAAQQMLLIVQTETSTIESIAAECGFGSKSSFNRAFKKYTNNLTPSEFVRLHKTTE